MLRVYLLRATFDGNQSSFPSFNCEWFGIKRWGKLVLLWLADQDCVSYLQISCFRVLSMI
jgi:hypothetical protein